MKKLVLLLLLIITCAFWSQSQIVFKGISPSSIAGSYDFTYTSSSSLPTPWGHSLATPGYYVEDTLMLVSDGLLAPSILSVSPNTGVAGQTLNVTITGLNTNFIQGSSTSAFFGFAQGSGTVLNSFTVNSKTLAVANITIPVNTYNGKYNLGVNEYLDGNVTLTNGFTVTGGIAVPSISLINPITAAAGQTLDVTITGLNTNFSQGSTTVNFGFDQGSSSVNSITVNNNTELTANITIPANTFNGDYNVTTTGFDGTLISTDKFKVTGGTIAPTLVSIAAASGNRGATLNVTITGLNTHFNQGSSTSLSFNFNQGSTTVVNSINATSATTLTANITIPSFIYSGDYNVSVYNSIDGLITLPNAFKVKGVTSDSLGCVATGNNLSGKIAVIYRGDCYFYNKIKYAQDRGARAVIIINNVDGMPIGMSGGTTAENALIIIPAIQISKADGAKFREQMKQGPVVAIIGNLTGFYQNNVSMYKDYIHVAKSYATPSLTVKDPSEMLLPLGGYIYNRGISTASATLSVKVKKNNTVLYTSTTDSQSLLTDSIGYFSFPSFPLADYSIGKYTVTYTASMGATQDLDLTDNTLTTEFEITDNIYSLVPLNTQGLPIVTDHQRSGSEGLTSFMQCIKYENANANRIGAEGIYFSATIDEGSIDGEEFNIQTYRWDDPFNPKASPFLNNFQQLNELNSTIYNIKGDIQKQMIYVPFSASIPLEDDTKYLFCITPTTNSTINFGYNTVIDYGLNDFISEESSHPFKSVTDVENWYSGFVQNLVPAFGIRTADKATLGLSSSVNKIEGIIYPNPSNDAITISLNVEGVAKLVVTDIMGKVVMNNSINLTNGKTRVDINSLESGMYIFNVLLENGTSSQYNIVKK